LTSSKVAMTISLSYTLPSKYMLGTGILVGCRFQFVIPERIHCLLDRSRSAHIDHDAQFDFALMVTTICFLDNIDVALKEAYRILKPGGFFITGLIDKDSPIGKSYQQHKNESAFYRVATFYSVNEVVSHLKKASFRKFTFTQTIFHDLAEIRDVESVKKGMVKDSFVVIRAMK